MNNLNNPKNILLIDDDPLVAQLIGMLIETFRGEAFALERIIRREKRPIAAW